MKTFIKLILLGIFITLLSCEDDTEDQAPTEQTRKITGAGEVVSESEIVHEFNSIDLQNVSNVYVTTGKDRKIVFTAYENIVPYMEATVVGDELLLKFNSNISVNSDEEIRVDVSVPELDKVTLSGVGNFYLNGKSQRSLNLYISGVGNIYAYNLPVLYGLVDITGNGNVEIDAKDNLTVDIDGLGNVFYKGNPELSVDIDGLGDIISDQ